MSTPIFVHIPKTAGSSLRTLITLNYNDDEVLSLYGNRREILQQTRAHLADRQRYKIIQGHTPYGTDRLMHLQGARYFCFVREPVARTMSDIAHSTRQADHGFHHIFSDATLTLDEKVRKAGEITYYRNNMTHFLSGTFYTREISMTDYYTAVDNLWRSEFVGISEDFERSTLIMGKLLGWTHFIPQICNMNPQGQPVAIAARTKQLCEQYLEYDLHLYALAQEHFAKNARRFGGLLGEAAQQLKEINTMQTEAYPDAKYATYLVGEPIIVPVTDLHEEIDPATPLARWISTPLSALRPR